MARCAREVGCSQAQISKLLKGEITASEFVGPISDWLVTNGVAVARPQVSVSEDRERELLETAADLDDARFAQVLQLARLLKRR